MNFGHRNQDFYEEYDCNTFFTIKDLQKRISKLFINEDLLNAAVFWYTNIERQKHGLPQFKYHNKLKQMATLQSRQMREHNFFDHENRFDNRYKTLSDRLESVKDDTFDGFVSFAENIADCPVIKANESFTFSFKNDIVHLYSLDGKEIYPFNYSEMAMTVVNAWMNSPGHRANIMNHDYIYLGCGCAPYEKKGHGYSITYFKLTQNFGGMLMPPSITTIVKKTIKFIKQKSRDVFNPHISDKPKSNVSFGGMKQN